MAVNLVAVNPVDKVRVGSDSVGTDPADLHQVDIGQDGTSAAGWAGVFCD